MYSNSSFDQNHAYWMSHALRLAQQAADVGEVPVGAVVVKDGQIVGEGANAPLSSNDPTAHAEVQALRDAARRLGNYRLEGCSLYVTLEPCTMCSGALLHARVDAVVYGAAEPKTGAAGSVLNVFDYPQINHRTKVVRGVLADECSELMALFFQERRAFHKAQALANHPLKDTALRNPDSAFTDLPNWSYVPQLRSDLPALQGLRMAVVDEGPRDASITWLCLHGAASWGYVFAPWVPVLLAAGHRVVIPDLLGFGRSDQPKRDKAHTAQWHVEVLQELLCDMDLRQVVLLGQGDGGRLGLAVADAQPQRFVGAWLMDVWPDTRVPKSLAQWLQAAANKPAWDVGQGWGQAGFGALAQDQQAIAAIPFAKAGHRAALKAWPKVQAQLPPVPQVLLEDWLEQGRCIVSCSASNQLMPLDAWRNAWLAAAPALEQYPEVLQQTPMPPLVPGLATTSVRQAMEYFAGSAKTSV